MGSSDEQLCRAVAEREPGAFDLLVERYQERAYRIAWSVLRDREDARDCSQEAFIRLHESAGSFAGQSKFSTWFYRILVNCCLDQQRRRWGRLARRREDRLPLGRGALRRGRARGVGQADVLQQQAHQPDRGDREELRGVEQ